MDVLVRNGRIVTVDEIVNGDILVIGGKISNIAPSIEPSGMENAGDLKIFDGAGKFILPGVIDAHTHYHLESRDTVTADGFFSGSRAAAFGGVTTAIDFADDSHERTLAADGKARRDAMAAEMAIDFALHQGVYRVKPGLRGELETLKESGITAVKIFTTYKREGYLIDESGLGELFTACRDLKMMVTVHAEDEETIEKLEEEYAGRPLPPSMHPVIRPSEAEGRAVKRIGELAGKVGMPIYIVHLSSASGYEAVKELAAMGVKIGVETTPHYLLLSADLLEGPEAQKFIMTPPLRTKTDNNALWSGIEEGRIHVVATDHCAFTLAQKLASNDCTSILPGIPGTEELLPLLYTFGTAAGRFDIRRLVSLLSTAPAEMFGIDDRKGSLAPGKDGDLVIFDPEAEWIMTDKTQHTGAGYTPYEGMKIRGRPETVILRGEILVHEGKFFGRKGSGRFLPENESALYRR